MKKIKMSKRMKKACGLAFLGIVVLITVFIDVGANSGGKFGRAVTGCGNGCHGAEDPSITVSITGLPAQYTPLQTYTLIIAVSGGPATPRGGFNLLVSAGTLSTSDSNVQINGALDQATHTNENQRTWTVDWTAPASGTGTVTVNLAAMAAGDPPNKDGDSWKLYSTTVPELIVVNNPPEAQSLTVQGFSEGSAGIAHITDHTPILGWTFVDQDGGDTQQQYEVRVGTSSGASDMWAPGSQSGAASSEVYAGLTLLDNTDYWFGVRVNDGTDWSVWNETQFHMNSLEAQSLTVQGFAQGTTGIMHITDHTPDLNWSFWDGEADSQQQYDVRVGTAPGLSDMWAPGPQTGAINSVLYAGLTLVDGTDYWFGIRVNDNYEWSVWNETQFHMNSVEARSLTVQGFAVGSPEIMHISDHTPFLNWSFFDGELDSQQQYEVRVGTASGLSDMWAPGPQIGATNSEMYIGIPLIDGSDYWFGVRVFDGYEWSQWNETIFHMNALPEAQDLTVQGFADGSPNIIHITDHNPILGWIFFDLDGGDTQQMYEIRVGTASGLSDMWAPGPLIGPINSATYAGLSLLDGVDYWFGIRVYDGYEWSAWNETMFHMNALSEAQSLTVDGFTDGTVGIMHIINHIPDLNWSFFDAEGDTQQQYEVRVGTASGLSDMWSPGAQGGAINSVIYGGLSLLDGTDYWFGIRVYDGYEWSVWNETQFHMNSLPPAPVLPITPPDDSNIPSSSAQTLSWTSGGADPEGDIITYYWYVDTDNPPVAPYVANDFTTTTSSNSFVTLPSTDYYWYINTTDGWEWNSTIVWNFTTSAVVNNPPEAQNLTVQGFADGTTGIMHIMDHTPDLNWSFFDPDGGDTQQQYEVRVGTASGLSDMWMPGVQPGSINTIIYAGSLLQDGIDYWLGIRVYDGNTWSAWNETQFHMNSMEARSLNVQGFAEGSIGIMHVTDHTPDLNWSFWDGEVESQQQYEVRVGTGPGLSDMWSPGPQAGPVNSVIYSGLTLLDGMDYWFGIRVYDGYEWSEWNETQFHMNSLPPAPVPPLSPPDDANIPSSPAQTLGWTVGGMDTEGDTITYYWFVDVDNPPVPPYLANGTTFGTSSTSFTTSPGTNYYWYINATDGWEWNSTMVWNFTTSAVVNNPPEAQGLLVQGFSKGTPEIMHVTDHTPDLNWSFFDPDIGDTQQEYEIRIGTASGLSDMWAPGPQVGAANSDTYAGLTLLDGTDYWFGIRVYDGNTWSAWNETQFHMNSLPPAPVPPLNPQDDANISSSPAQTLSWTSGGADGEGDTITYYWYVDTDNPPMSPYLANGSTTGTSSSAFSTAPGVNYYWYVNATDGWEWNSTIVWNFTTAGVANTPPEAQDLAVQGFAPGSIEIIHVTDHTPDLSWAFFDSDLGDFQQQYEVRVGSASGLSDMWAPGPQIGATITEVYSGLLLFDGTDYWFGVRVYDGFDWSPWNETIFHMNSIPEAKNIKVQGFSNGSLGILHIIDHSPNLNWTTSDNEGDIQQQYEVRVGTASGLSNMWAPGAQVGTNFSTLYEGLSLIDGGDYWFGIRVYDGYEWSVWNETQFHMNSLPPAPVPPLNPADDANITSNPIQTLNWTSGGADAEGDTITYYWYVDTDNPPASPYLASNITIGTFSTSFATIQSTIYYWYVNATDGWEWNSSIVWNFTTANPPNNPPEVQILTLQGFMDGSNEIYHIIDHTPELEWQFLDSDVGDFQQQYDVRVGTMPGQSNVWAPGPKTGAVNTVTYAGLPLQDGSVYWFGIRVNDGQNWSSWEEIRFSMNALPEVQNLYVNGFGEGTPEIMYIPTTTPELSGSYMDIDGGSEQQYDLRVGTASGLSDMWALGSQSGAFEGVTYAGQSLLKDTDYWYGLRVYDGYEWSEWEEIQFHTNSPPELDWTGESNYISSGVYPLSGDTSTEFIFKIKYTDIDDNQPASGSPKLHIKKGGLEIMNSPFTMIYESGENSTGAVYFYPISLKPGTDYIYFFSASDEPGEFAVPTTEQDGPDVMDGLEILIPPTNLKVSASTEMGKLLISWDLSLDANVTGYKIYRSIVPFSSINESEYELVATVDAQIISFTDTNLDDGVTYYYLIKAFDISGNESPYSDEAEGKTISEPRDDEGLGSGIWILLFVIILALFIILIYVYLFDRRKKEREPSKKKDEKINSEAVVEGEVSQSLDKKEASPSEDKELSQSPDEEEAQP